MPRRGVNLTEEQWRLVKSRAAQRGCTISEYIAELIEPGPTNPQTVSRPLLEAFTSLAPTVRPAPKPGKKR